MFTCDFLFLPLFCPMQKKYLKSSIYLEKQHEADPLIIRIILLGIRIIEIIRNPRMSNFQSNLQNTPSNKKMHHSHNVFRIKSIYALTCLLNASGMVKVDEIQQNVFTTWVGSPLTIHWMGLPTNWLAVMITLPAIKSTVVKSVWRRKIAQSVVISCHFK